MFIKCRTYYKTEELCRTQWLLSGVPLTKLKKSAVFASESASMFRKILIKICFYLSEQILFVMEMQCIYSEIGTEFFYIFWP